MASKRFMRILKDKQNNLYSECVQNMGQLSNCPKEETNLVYDFETKVVYYMFNEYVSVSLLNLTAVGYLSPYISENGKYCRFNDNLNRIEEIG